jgi:demethylmenaquinone methyltransferase/2-methoxy-6-polyprenyl-1,4-benzoquinol methylase
MPFRALLGSGAHYTGIDVSRAEAFGMRQNPDIVAFDGRAIPFPDAFFDHVLCTEVLEHAEDPSALVAEMLRVLRPGGECGILDFGEPSGLIGKLYRIYFKRVLPAVGTVISGVQGPYKYLPASVERFPPPEEMLDRMRQAGFQHASWTPYTFGVAGLYRGVKEKGDIFDPNDQEDWKWLAAHSSAKVQ